MRNYCIGIIGTSSLWDRTENLIKQLGRSGLDIKINSQEPESIDIPDMIDSWKKYIAIIKRSLLINIYLRDKSPKRLEIELNNEHEWMNYRKLTQGEISLYFKHKRLLSEFSVSKYDHMVVMEDDVIIDGEVWGIIDVITEVTDYDYVDLGGGCLLKGTDIDGVEPIKIGNDTGIYKVPWKSSRSTCCYLISKRTATLFSYINMHDYVLPIDWALTYFFNKADIERIYWAEGTGLVHGSQTGKYKSSLQS